MAKSFKEIGKKAESLIEQGKEADQKVQSCQNRVASSNSRVAAARRQLAAASETDEEGNPIGDVERARALLSMAENQLAASQRALSSARGDADRVRQQKNAHVQEIERHNQVERSNLEKLRRLRSGAFGAASAALTEGMAQRLNEAEDARVALLRSMGIDAVPNHVTVGVEGSADSGWRGGGFAALDTTGQVQSYQGGSERLSSSNRIVADNILSHVPPERKQTVEQAYKNAPYEVISMLNSYANVLQPVVDSGYGRNEYGMTVKKGSFYSPDLNQVKMNEHMDDDEYQEVLPHELSRFLDHQRGWDSSKPEFIAALDSDLKKLDRSTPEGRLFFNEMLDDAVNSGAADDRAISDLLFGAFGENGNDPEIKRRFEKEGIAEFTHSDEYWMGINEYGQREKDGGASMRRAEIYAEIGAIRCLNDRISNNFLERYFPGIYNQYNSFYHIVRRE